MILAGENKSILAKIREHKAFKIFRYIVTNKSETTMTLDVEEEIESLDYDGICKLWNVAPDHKLGQ